MYFLIGFVLYLIFSIVGLVSILVIYIRQRRWEKIHGPIEDYDNNGQTVEFKPIELYEIPTNRIPFLDVDNVWEEPVNINTHHVETMTPRPKPMPKWRQSPSLLTARQCRNIRTARKRMVYR